MAPIGTTILAHQWSHGCIHLRPGEDQWLYSWAEPGTDVYINW
ncbi:MAG: L,D-transpeptidase [Caldilineaceae bacterium]